MKSHAYTQAQMAERLGVRQPQISRILRGNFSLRSTAVREWCTLAGVPMTAPDPAYRPRSRQELDALLDDVWDGTVEDIGRVAALLNAAAELRRGIR
jgi:transcriptional regulator with XRE-family HTH domain